MSPSNTTARLVPTLTEVLDVSALQMLDGQQPQLPHQAQTAATPFDLDAQRAASAQAAPAVQRQDDALKQALQAAVDTALAELRGQLLVQLQAQLEPLFEKRAAEQI